MFGLPLHPLVVHLPIVFAVFMPLLALWAFWRSRREPTHRSKPWVILTVAQAVLAVSAFLAVRSGEADEERAEKKVGEARLEQHEDQGKRFALVASGTTILALGGFLPVPFGTAAQALALTATLGQGGLIFPLGHSGAAMVHGPAQAGALSEAGAEGGADAGEGGEKTSKGDSDDD